ncbi:class I SAM-dependent methyltransferase [Micromonospora sp. NPDC005979]|uniref:class I SAM-dependent methyltransferase n=1 Tax=Micromonospora sp. NPDC005979 TaxID=3156726 RepID=UPI0033AE9CE8
MSKYIDFHDPHNRDTYVGRSADPAWSALFARLMRPEGRLVADLGCGGGIYTKAIAGMAPQLVVGMDSSHLSLESARSYCQGVDRVSFLLTDAEAVGAEDDVFDGVVERALIHHFTTLHRNFREARRILKPAGLLWVQDRTVDDVLQPPSAEHIRGYYLAFDERLRATEIERRRREPDVTAALLEAGFRLVNSSKVCELRKVFREPGELYEEIVLRRGRSLLHALDDRRIRQLADYVVERIPRWPAVERDTWTVWIAEK